MSRLIGKRVVFTRPLGEGAQLARLLAAHGAVLVEHPVLVIEPVRGEELRAARATIAALGTGHYHGLLFTSRTAVDRLYPLLHAANIDVSHHPRAFAVGRKTAAALARLGITAQVASQSTSEGLLATVRAAVGNPKGLRFLFPRARHGRLAVLAGLRRDGATVDSLILYDTVAQTTRPPLPPDVDWITFMSPSAVTAFVERDELPSGAQVACIGPTTRRAAEAAGLRVDVIASEQSVEALVAAMAQHS